MCSLSWATGAGLSDLAKETPGVLEDCYSGIQKSRALRVCAVLSGT